MIMQVDSRIIGQDYISHTSDCGSPSSYSSYSTGSGSKLTVGASSLGSTLSTISQVTDGDSMVETELDAEERTPYSSNPTISDSLNSPCGRIRHGMGSSPPSGQQGRIFDRKRKSVFNQCEGVDSNILCSTTPRKKFKGKRDQSSHRQHDSIKVCDEVGGGDGFSTTTGFSNTDTGPTQSTPAECLLPSCGGSEEHGSRHPQSSQTISVRVIHSKSLLQPSEGQMGKTMEDRCLCGLTQQSTQKILEHEQRPVCQQDRCLSTNLDQKRPLYVPSVEADSANFAKTQIRQNQGSDAGNTSMNKSILVPNATQDETPQRANNLEDKPMESYRVALINNKRKGLGMSDQLIVYLNKANRPSTT